MAKITEISFGKKNGNRVNIYLDGSFFAACFADIAVKNGLKSGVEVSEEQILQLLADEEKEKAWNKALGYIAKYVKTEKEVKDFLKKKEFSYDAINYAISKLKDYNYLNDENFVKSYISSNENYRGIKDIKQRLIQKGIKREVAEKVVISEETKSATALKIAEKYMKNREFNKENYYKLSGYLYNKGFDSDDITDAVNKIFRGKNDWN